MPIVPVNYGAVLVCGIISVVLGSVWFGALFGKYWTKLMGWSSEDMKNMMAQPGARTAMYRSYAIAFVAALVAAFVLDHSLIFAANYLQVSGVSAGLMAGFWSWIGFIAPATLGMVL
jgi:ABC-type spermidine/putrescine transport system permease subunit II